MVVQVKRPKERTSREGKMVDGVVDKRSPIANKAILLGSDWLCTILVRLCSFGTIFSGKRKVIDGGLGIWPGAQPKAREVEHIA